MHKCEKCGKRFLSSKVYKDHVDAHDNGRGFGCPLCNVRTVQFHEMQERAKEMHGKWLARDDDPRNRNGCKIADKNFPPTKYGVEANRLRKVTCGCPLCPKVMVRFFDMQSHEEISRSVRNCGQTIEQT